MNQPKHTEGPWVAVESQHKVEWSHWIETPEGKLIAAVAMGPHADGNARLIVSVKDLLAALIETTRALETHLRDERTRLDLVLTGELCPCESGELPRAHAAIRKATGEGE